MLLRDNSVQGIVREYLDLFVGYEFNSGATTMNNSHMTTEYSSSTSKHSRTKSGLPSSIKW